MRNRKVLKNFYFRQKFRPDKQHLWKCMLPSIRFDFIEQDNWYQQNKNKFLTKGPKVWLLKLIHEKGPLRIDAIYEIYRKDPQLLEQEFFEDLNRNFIRIYHKERFIYAAPFKQPNFKGFIINEKNGLDDIDPQIQLTFDPLPINSITKRYIDKLNKEKRYINQFVFYISYSILSCIFYIVF